MAVSPREDFVAVQRQANGENRDLCKATVMAIGPGLPVNEPVAPDLEVGDTVIIRKDAGETLTHEDVEYVIVRNSEVRVKL